ncbi:Arylsulfatase B [Halotydeus destructor]|nr:Arylsulfatase B [Halotydeus destructor]
MMLPNVFLLVSFLPYFVSSAQPNVVLIVADDLGWGDVSFHGSNQVKTPNIDQLASSGAILNSYYVSPICSPSRSALLSGRHPIHTGMQHNVLNGAEPWGLPLKFKLLPQFMKDLNYTTRAVGKWHLGFYKKAYFPTMRGFDSHFGYLTGHEDYFDHTAIESMWGNDLRRNFDKVGHLYTGKYSTEMYTKEATDIISNHNQSSPMFLYLAYQAVHAGNLYSPLQVPDKYQEKFKHIADPNRRKFVAMVSALDDAVGQVVQALDRKSMLSNTIIIFTTDNGGATGGALGRIDGSYGSNWPLRGTKYTLWEGGIRGVSFVWSSQLRKPGFVYDGLAHVSDWLPTINEAVGGKASDLPVDLYGHSLWPYLVNGQTGSVRDTLLHNIDDIWRVYAIRQGNLKLVSGSFEDGRFDGWFMPPGVDGQEFEDHEVNSESLVSQVLKKQGYNRPAIRLSLNCSSTVVRQCDPKAGDICLFDIDKDPCERDNIAKLYPEKTIELQRVLQLYNNTAVKPANQPADSKADPVFHNHYWDYWMD